MEEILRLLNIDSTGDLTDNKYTENIDSYNEFTDYYNAFESSLDIGRDSNESYMDEDDIYILFVGDNFKVELTGSLEKDNYKLEITKE